MGARHAADPDLHKLPCFPGRGIQPNADGVRLETGHVTARNHLETLNCGARRCRRRIASERNRQKKRETADEQRWTQIGLHASQFCPKQAGKVNQHFVQLGVPETLLGQPSHGALAFAAGLGFIAENAGVDQGHFHQLGTGAELFIE